MQFKGLQRVGPYFFQFVPYAPYVCLVRCHDRNKLIGRKWGDEDGSLVKFDEHLAEFALAKLLAHRFRCPKACRGHCTKGVDIHLAGCCTLDNETITTNHNCGRDPFGLQKFTKNLFQHERHLSIKVSLLLYINKNLCYPIHIPHFF